MEGPDRPHLALLCAQPWWGVSKTALKSQTSVLVTLTRFLAPRLSALHVLPWVIFKSTLWGDTIPILSGEQIEAGLQPLHTEEGPRWMSWAVVAHVTWWGWAVGGAEGTVWLYLASFVGPIPECM